MQRRPIQHQQFLRQPETRRRYWARSLWGWPRIQAARPNPGHHALARLEQAGLLSGLITQNVDSLHHKAGSQHVVELHGSLARVRCLGCGRRSSRAWLQERLLALNPGVLDGPGGDPGQAEVAPDGDAELADSPHLDRFRVAACGHCGGVLMPDVIFFGGTVPRPVVEDCTARVLEAEALLVVGSSLTVFSGYRFVRAAQQAGVPVAILDLGPTRGDPLAAVKVEARLGESLPLLAERLAG